MCTTDTDSMFCCILTSSFRSWLFWAFFLINFLNKSHGLKLFVNFVYECLHAFDICLFHRKEMEKQKLLEWENSRKIELEQHRCWTQKKEISWWILIFLFRQRETEKVINLRAKKETIGSEFEAIVSVYFSCKLWWQCFSTQKTKVDDLTKNIADTRTGVTDVKQFIDGMRTARDTKMAELNALKAQLKEQNQRLLQVTQERAKIESKNKVNQRKMEDGVGKFIISELSKSSTNNWHLMSQF